MYHDYFDANIGFTQNRIKCQRGLWWNQVQRGRHAEFSSVYLPRQDLQDGIGGIQHIPFLAGDLPQYAFPLHG